MRLRTLMMLIVLGAIAAFAAVNWAAFTTPTTLSLVFAVVQAPLGLRQIEHTAWSQRAGNYDELFASISTQAVRAILDSLGSLDGKKLLDVACGTGHLVAAASQRGAASEGVDFAKPMINPAQVMYPRLLFKVADATQLPYEDHSLDAVTCAFGLSHMEEPQAAVNESFRVLKPGGRFAFTLWFGPEDSGEAFVIVKNALAAYATADIALPEKWTQLRLADEAACNSGTALLIIPVIQTLPLGEDIFLIAARYFLSTLAILCLNAAVIGYFLKELPFGTHHRRSLRHRAVLPVR